MNAQVAKLEALLTRIQANRQRPRSPVALVNEQSHPTQSHQVDLAAAPHAAAPHAAAPHSATEPVPAPTPPEPAQVVPLPPIISESSNTGGTPIAIPPTPLPAPVTDTSSKTGQGDIRDALVEAPSKETAPLGTQAPPMAAALPLKPPSAPAQGVASYRQDAKPSDGRSFGSLLNRTLALRPRE